MMMAHAPTISLKNDANGSTAIIPEKIDCIVPISRTVKTTDTTTPINAIHRVRRGRDRNTMPTRRATQKVTASVVSGRNVARLNKA